MRPSTDHPVDEPGWGPLARYVIAATLARTSDGGAVVAIVLMVNTSGGSGWLAGALGACITAPHLLGPFVARSLDTARDSRTVIAAAALAHGTTLAAAVLLYPHTHPATTAALLIISGLFGPLLTGGISSRLPAIAGHSQRRQRRAQGWNVATYGISGTVGPTLVAAVSAWASPTTAALTLAAGCYIAAVIRFLPYAPAPGKAADVPRPLRTLTGILASGPLRRTLYLTVTVALSVAALPVTAVSSTHTLGVSEYAPDNARGQIFVWVGALKITAGSAGTAAAGALISTSAALPLLLAVALTIASTLLSLAERRHNRRRYNAPCGPASPHTEPENGRPHPTGPTGRIHDCSNHG
ncbi:MFS transporter [Streptomyces sp. enrichment culture]|uniref:MFS transporter n=1 Tax=Streptomyces sp. enrichment culture TaxID=1795815 RepID=UPI003F569653